MQMIFDHLNEDQPLKEGSVHEVNCLKMHPSSEVHRYFLSHWGDQMSVHLSVPFGGAPLISCEHKYENSIVVS